MNILDLSSKFEARLEFEGDGVDYFDYVLHLDYAQGFSNPTKESLSLSRGDIDDLIEGLKQLTTILEQGK